MSDQHVEPWLSGTLTDVHPAIAPILYSFRQAVEDLEKWTEGLSDEQVWARPFGLGSVGFQLQHLAACERTDMIDGFQVIEHIHAGDAS